MIRALPILLLLGCVSPSIASLDVDPVADAATEDSVVGRRADASAPLIEAGVAPGSTAPTPAVTEPSGPGNASPRRKTLSARAGVLGVTVETKVEKGDSAARDPWILRGRTTRAIAEIQSYAHEDGLGDARAEGDRFEVAIRPDDHRSLLAGAPLFLRIVTKTGDPREYHARLSIGGRLESRGTERALRVEPELSPIFVPDPVDDLRLRAVVVATATPRLVIVEGLPSAKWTRLSSRTLAIDMLATDVVDAFAEGRELSLVASFASTHAKARAAFEVVVTRVELATETASRRWPPEVCRAETAACIARDSPGDLGGCGRYLEVRACRANAGD
jgi:hypothetical protein